MDKKPITWIGLVQEKMALKGKGTSIRDVAPEAKKEWIQIKEGKHPKYSQGKMTKSSKKNKKNNGKKNSNVSMKNVLSKCKLCPKCSKEIKRMMAQGQFGGDSCGSTTDQLAGAAHEVGPEAVEAAPEVAAEGSAQSGGDCGCGAPALMSGGGCGCGSQNGGKKRRMSKRKSKKLSKRKLSKKKVKFSRKKKYGGDEEENDPDAYIENRV